MRSGSWPRDGSVIEVSARAVLGGVEYQAEDMSVDREISSTLPEQTMAMGGYVPARAKLTIINHAGVTSRSHSAWNSRLPQPGDPAELYVSHGDQSMRIFKGLVDSVDGSATSQSIRVTLVDETDRLSHEFSTRPMASVLPPTSTSGSGENRHVDLHTTWLVDRVLRNCGYFTSPDRIGYCYLDVPLQGSAWPEIGTVDRAQRDRSRVSAPWWSTTHVGVSPRMLYARYFPDLARWGSRDGSLSYPLEFVFNLGYTHEVAGRITCEWYDGTMISVAVTPSKSVVLQFKWPDQDWTTILSATAGELGEGTSVVSVRLTPDNSRKVVSEIRSNKGGYARRTGSSLPYRTYAHPIESVTLDFPSNPIYGVQIGSPSNPSGLEDFTPTARLSPPVPFTNVWGTPPINRESALKLLKKWSAAECTAMWLDEDGVFQWVNREQFIKGEIVWDGDSLNDLHEIEWSHDMQGAARRAVVRYTEMAIQRTKRSRIKVWEGSGQTMDHGDVMEDFVTPPSDEIWIDVDGSPQEYQAETSKLAFAKALGSWWGYVAYDADGQVAGNTEWVGYTADIELVANSVWKITQAWDGRIPTGVDHIKLATQAGNTGLPEQWWNQPLPLLRARLRMIMSSASVALNGSGNRKHPDLIHDTDWWLQRREQAKSLAGWLASRLKKPLPVIESVDISPDPRLQLGDRIRLRDSHGLGMVVIGIITRISHQISRGSHAMEIGLLLTQSYVSTPTLADLDQTWAGETLQGFDAEWRGRRLEHLDSDPLRRSS